MAQAQASSLRPLGLSQSFLVLSQSLLQSLPVLSQSLPQSLLVLSQSCQHLSTPGFVGFGHRLLQVASLLLQELVHCACRPMQLLVHCACCWSHLHTSRNARATTR